MEKESRGKKRRRKEGIEKYGTRKGERAVKQSFKTELGRMEMIEGKVQEIW